MKNNTRKIVVLDKLDSPRIEQAIFILRDDAQFKECDAVAEAQRIVENYLSTLTNQHQETVPKRKLRPGFIIGMALYTFTTIVLTTYLLAMIR